MGFQHYLFFALTVKACSGFLFDCSLQYGHCERYGNLHVCGTNHVTYQNWCYLQHDNCFGSYHIGTLHRGPCHDDVIYTTSGVVSGGFPTNPSPTTDTMVTTTSPTSTAPPTSGDACASALTTQCPGDINPICASNNNWYLNMCEFIKAACSDPNITILHVGMC